jgi:hypothetical protein
VWEIARNLISDGFTPVAINRAIELAFMAFFPEILSIAIELGKTLAK